MKFRYHGNYCGPNWSAGKYQGSVIDRRVRAVDEFDATCRDHDAAYARKRGLKAADYVFYRKNIGKGLKRSLAALAVGAQGFFRRPDKSESDVKTFSSKSDMPPARSRSRGRKRVRSISDTPKSGLGSRSKSKSRSLSKVRKRIPGDVKAKKKVSFVPTHSTGYVGRFAKAKTQRRRVASKYDKYGAVLKKECYHTVSDEECVYVGHGIPVGQCVRQLWRAAYRRLLSKAGYDFKSWNDLCELPTCFIQTKYSVGISAPATPINTGCAPTGTHMTVSQQIADDIATAITNASNSIQFLEMTLFHVEDTGETEVPISLARINLIDFHVSFDYYSIVKVKNISLANSEVYSYDTNNVDAQPLVGRLYKQSDWLNGFQVLKDNSATRAIIAADRLNGLLWVVPDDLGASDAFNAFKKPPPAYGFGCKKSAVIRLNPAEIKSHVLKWKANMRFNTAVQKLLINIDDTTKGDNLIPFGSAAMFGLEREVEIGSALNSIQVSFQVDFVLKVVGREVKSKVLPIVDTVE